MILMAALNFISNVLFRHRDILATLTRNTVLLLLGTALVLFAISRINKPICRYIQALTFFVLSGPTLMGGSDVVFFGFWLMISGAVILYKYSFFKRFTLVKSSCMVAWAIFWLSFYLIRNNLGSPISALTLLLFLVSSLVVLYFAFEEDLRELLRSNTKKDGELERQKAVIDQLEPLSVLGERVSHVAHSFKNNLTQLSAAVYYIEEGNDPRRAAERIRHFSLTMSERIDNLLMIAHANGRLEPEILDLGRLLDGVKLLYLEEPHFLKNASYRLDAASGILVRAVRWDVLLLLENLLKNAVEAIIGRGIHGFIEIRLARGSLRISDNGGPMRQCSGCPGPESGSCLGCPRIGKPGHTTKEGGTGTGLSQVLRTVRDHGWDLRLENTVDGAAVRISFPVEPAAG
jgi:signal transduction histidine kinase